MAYIIQITIPGGMYLGPEKDTLQAINADGITKHRTEQRRWISKFHHIY